MTNSAKISTIKAELDYAQKEINSLRQTHKIEIQELRRDQKRALEKQHHGYIEAKGALIAEHASQVEEQKVQIAKAQQSTCKAVSRATGYEKRVHALMEEVEGLTMNQDLKAPLVDIGVCTRRRFLEQARFLAADTPRSQINAAARKAGNNAAHEGNWQADHALRKSGFASQEDIAIFETLYGIGYDALEEEPSKLLKCRDFVAFLRMTRKFPECCEMVGHGVGTFEALIAWRQEHNLSYAQFNDDPYVQMLFESLANTSKRAVNTAQRIRRVHPHKHMVCAPFSPKLQRQPLTYCSGMTSAREAVSKSERERTCKIKRSGLINMLAVMTIGQGIIGLMLRYRSMIWR